MKDLHPVVLALGDGLLDMAGLTVDHDAVLGVPARCTPRLHKPPLTPYDTFEPFVEREAVYHAINVSVAYKVWRGVLSRLGRLGGQLRWRAGYLSPLRFPKLPDHHNIRVLHEAAP